MAEIRLTAGNDVYVQSEANRNFGEQVWGEAGNDSIKLYQGTAIGGAGNDRLEFIPVPGEPWWSRDVAYWNDNGVTVNLAEGWALDSFGGTDTLINVDKLHGNGGNDSFTGHSGNNYFWGNGGRDTLNGGAGNDGIGIGGFSPGDGQPWRNAQLEDLNVSVSADGRQATITLKSGTGFEYRLTDIEYFDYEAPTGWTPVFLGSFITQADMAEDIVAAGPTFRWNAAQPLGTAVNLSYSFVTSAPASGVGAPGFRAFTSAEQQLVRDILADTAALTGITFTERVESGSTVGQLRFGVSQQAATQGVSWMPGQTGAGSLAGDVWMDVESMVGLKPGSEGYLALLHEIGHALGLRHTQNVDAGDKWAMQLREVDDRTALTVMSQEASADGLFRSEWGPLDVLALRWLYGERSVDTANTVHVLGNQNAGSQTTITDDGGTDTLNASALTLGVSISLMPGGLSSVGLSSAGFAGVDNLAIAATTVIENVIGSRLDDVLTGNDGNNRITGGLGNDWIEGGKGNDTAVFAGNYADYEVSNGYGKVFVEARDGRGGFDTLIQIESMAFADRTVAVDRATVSGTVQQGQTLTATVTVADTTGNGAYSYQWRAGSNDIAGATQSTFVPGQAQVNQALSVVIRWDDDAGHNESLSSVPTVPVANVNDAPAGSVRISGVAAVGQTLTASHTLTDADGMNGASFQWVVGGVLTSWGSTTYTVQAGDLGKVVTVYAQYDDWGGKREVVNAGTAPVAGVSRTGTPAADSLTGDNGENVLLGLDANDTLNGQGGNDSLDGGVGNDSMNGGGGNDLYIIGSSGDKVVETDASLGIGGRDLVHAGVTHTLAPNVEDLVLQGNAALGGTGNALANKITGNGGANALAGGAGNDSLSGGDGNDTLDGGSGNDSLTGGLGNDRYVVDSSVDKVVEASAGGTDSVSASVTFTLAANVEMLTLTGIAAINGTGNTASNTITGNSAVNSLDGGDGNDSLSGADGVDTLSGGNGNDSLSGGNGNDSMIGGAGNDNLAGGAGLDVFRFSSALNGSSNVDTVVDFSVADDSLQLENLVFTKLTTAGALSSAFFHASTSGAAVESNDHVLYETDTGKLFYDADGSGAGLKVLISTLTTMPALTAADIFVT